MPPMFTEPINLGLNGSDTSYCWNSPVPQHETYRNRSSSERLMSVTNGGAALNCFRAGGSDAGSAGSAGISIAFAVLVLVPEPNRRRQIFERGHHTGESIGPGRIVRRSQLQHHLLLCPQI